MSEQPRPSQDPLEHLIRVAGRREAPPAQAYERALAAATLTLESKLRRRRWRQVASLAAGIATLGLGANIAFDFFKPAQVSVQPVANVVRVIGDVQVRPADARHWVSLRGDTEPLLTGTLLRTEAASAAAIQIAEVSVRIAGGSEVEIESKSRLRLALGRLYVDTGLPSGAGRIHVVTDAASVSDVGTQFEVQYREGDYRVRVREGEVILQHGARRERGVAGEQISINSAGSVRHTTFAPNDPAWQWVQPLASAPDIDNQPLTILLAWVARETGLTVRYATPAIERQAGATILHGSIRHLEPLQALAVMMATTDLRHELRPDGTIMIK